MAELLQSFHSVRSPKLGLLLIGTFCAWNVQAASCLFWLDRISKNEAYPHTYIDSDLEAAAEYYAHPGWVNNMAARVLASADGLKPTGEELPDYLEKKILRDVQAQMKKNKIVYETMTATRKKLTGVGFEILPGDQSEVNRFAQDLKDAMGIRLIYSPKILRQAVAMYERRGNIIYIPLRLLQTGQVNTETLHEVIHAIDATARREARPNFFNGILRNPAENRESYENAMSLSEVNSHSTEARLWAEAVRKYIANPTAAGWKNLYESGKRIAMRGNQVFRGADELIDDIKKNPQVKPELFRLEKSERPGTDIFQVRYEMPSGRTLYFWVNSPKLQQLHSEKASHTDPRVIAELDRVARANCDEVAEAVKSARGHFAKMEELFRGVHEEIEPAPQVLANIAKSASQPISGFIRFLKTD